MLIIILSFIFIIHVNSLSRTLLDQSNSEKTIQIIWICIIIIGIIMITGLILILIYQKRK